MARDDLSRAAHAAEQAAEAALDADAAAAEAMIPFESAPWLEPIADLGDQPQLRTLSIALVAAGLAAGPRVDWGARLARAGLRMLIAHELATFAKSVVKRRVDRTRPRSADAPGKDHRPSPGSNRHKEESSFPSGHAAGASAVSRAFARELPELAPFAAAAGATLSLVQVPRCAHYPTDTAAGVAIGLAAEAALARLWPAPSPSANQPATVKE